MSIFAARLLWLANADPEVVQLCSASTRKDLVSIAVLLILSTLSVVAATAIAIREIALPPMGWLRTILEFAVALPIAGTYLAANRYALELTAGNSRRLVDGLIVVMTLAYAAAVTVPLELSLFAPTMEIKAQKVVPRHAAQYTDVPPSPSEGVESSRQHREFNEWRKVITYMRNDWGHGYQAIEIVIGAAAWAIALLPFLIRRRLESSEYGCVRQALANLRAQQRIHGNKTQELGDNDLFARR